LSTVSHRGHCLPAALITSAILYGCAALLSATAGAADAVPLRAPTAQQQRSSEVDRGHYLAIAADCAACHTVPGSKQLFAGGYAINSPMGQIYSSNITPSKTYGIGNYSQAQFARAVREGINDKGQHLYPAMPYASYAGMADSDVDALYRYFMTSVTPVEHAAPPTHLQFPFDMRALMLGWNLLFLDHGTPAAKAPETGVARGKYLVDNVEHCAECHSPRNALMAVEHGADALSGANLGGWYAPNITNSPTAGVGGWSDQELVQYLKTGHVTGKGQAAGPMAEAVTNSLQYLPDSDLQAMVQYLRTLPSNASVAGKQPAFSYGTAVNSEAQVIGQRPMQVAMAPMSGQQLYENTCASCHQSDGMGTADGAYPSLVHNTALGGSSPNNLVSVILNGVDRDVAGQHVLMPAFGPDSEVQALNDSQVADLANYLFSQFGNPRLKLTSADVTTLRTGGNKPLIATLALPAFCAGIVVVAGLVIWLLIRVRRGRSASPQLTRRAA